MLLNIKFLTVFGSSLLIKYKIFLYNKIRLICKKQRNILYFFMIIRNEDINYNFLLKYKTRKSNIKTRNNKKSDIIRKVIY